MFVKAARMLLIDGSKSSRKATRQAFRLLGLRQTMEADSCHEALRLLKRSSFDLIVADQDLPDQSAYELVAMLQESETWASIPVIITGSFQSSDEIKTAMSTGIEFLLIKPLIPAMIEEMMHRVSVSLVNNGKGLLAKARETTEEAAPSRSQGPFLSRRACLILDSSTVLDRALRIEADNYEALCVLAEGALLEGRYSTAVKSYLRAIDVDKRNSLAYLGLSQIYIDEEKYDAAVKILTLHKEMSHSPEACQMLGYAYLKAEQFEDALQVFEEGIKYAELLDIPAKVFAAHYDGLGQVYSRLAASSGNKSFQRRAVEHYERSVELDPERVSAKYNLMVSYEDINETERSSAILDELKQRTPKEAQDWGYLGLALLREDEREAATEAFTQALKLVPHDLALLRQVDESYMKAGMPSEAAEIWSRSGHHHKAVIAYNRYGLILRKQKKYQEAVVAYGKALEFDSVNLIVLCNLARAHIEAREPEKAVQVLQRALEIDSANVTAKQLLKFVVQTASEGNVSERLAKISEA